MDKMLRDRLVHGVNDDKIRRNSDDSDEQPIMTVRQGQECSPPMKVHVVINETTVPMEVDTGASVSIMGEATYCKLWPRQDLSKTDLHVSYRPTPKSLLQLLVVQMSYQGQTPRPKLACDSFAIYM